MAARRYIRITSTVLALVLAFPAMAQTPTPFADPWGDELDNNPEADPPKEKREQPETDFILRNATPLLPEKLVIEREKEKEIKPAGPSMLESMYSKRIVDELDQFGYDMFGTSEERKTEASVMPMGAVQDDFVLSSGDELEITFTGQRNDRGTYKIDSKGMVLISDFPPIPAAGRSIGQVRLSIQAAAGNLYNMEAFVSLSSVKQVNVLIVGHVKKPGRQTLTVFSTVLDALMQAGGVQKTGSLRQIKLVRDGRSNIIDLYALLMQGSTVTDLQLKDGDRLIIPAIGPTVAIAGEVKRPGVFEIQPRLQGMLHEPEKKSEKISLNDMLELAGGVLAPGKNRFLKMEVTSSGLEKVDEVAEPFASIFGDGTILMVSKGEEKREGMVELEGHTRRPGMHSLAEHKTLSSLISSSDVLGPEIYPLIGVIERWNSLQLTHELIDFPLKLVLSGDYDRGLEDGDTIHLFSTTQIKNLMKKSPGKIQPVSYGSNEGPDPEFIEDPTLQSFLKERAAFVRGAVRDPGPYPIAEGITLDNLLAAAGGLALEANTSNIEVTSALQGEGHQANGRSGTRRLNINMRDTNPTSVPVGAGDSIRINQKFKKIEDKSVMIIGEVANPGRYDLVAGDKLSDLLNRAGGLTNEAYADGAIFSRAAERRAEEARFKAQARSLQQSIAAALETEDKDKKINAEQLGEARALAKELEQAEGVGRITVTSDPAILAVKPELDLLLEPGDRLYIPKRSLTVRVSGDVLSAAALQFREDKKPIDYINEAGGFTYNADKDRTFVLYPDGSAQPLQVSSWNYNPVFVPPGSTIVVPRDPKPFDFIESAKDISQILSNLAITSIFIDDIRDED